MTDEAQSTTLEAVPEPAVQLRVRNRQTLLKPKKKRTKFLHFEPRNDTGCIAGFGGEGSCFLRLYSSLQSNDVVFASSIGGSHIHNKKQSCNAGNKRYLSILRKHHEQFLNSSNSNRNAIVKLIVEETQKTEPPARFIASRLGASQWVEMNESHVEKSIYKDLHSLTTKFHCTMPMPIKRAAKSHQTKLPPKKKSKKAVFTPEIVSLLPPSAFSNLLCLPEMASEREKLSDFNRLTLENLEGFRATPSDATTSRGRVVGQIGIRCRHCVNVKTKITGSASYPGRLEIVDFNINLIGTKHFAGIGNPSGGCPYMPEELRRRIAAAKPLSTFQTKARGGSGFLRYFTHAAALCGVVDSAHGLKLARRPEGTTMPSPVLQDDPIISKDRSSLPIIATPHPEGVEKASAMTVALPSSKAKLVSMTPTSSHQRDSSVRVRVSTAGNILQVVSPVPQTPGSILLADVTNTIVGNSYAVPPSSHQQGATKEDKTPLHSNAKVWPWSSLPPADSN